MHVNAPRWIHPGNVWVCVRVPEVPLYTPIDMQPYERILLERALKVLRCLTKPDGTRRTRNGLYRLALKRWPAERWDDIEIHMMTEAWAIAGMPALIEYIKGGGFSGGRCKEPRNKLIRSKAVEGPIVFNPEVFIDAYSLAGASKHPEIEWRVYRIDAVAEYGRYSFNLACRQPPRVEAIEWLCIFHNQVQ